MALYGQSGYWPRVNVRVLPEADAGNLRQNNMVIGVQHSAQRFNADVKILATRQRMVGKFARSSGLDIAAGVTTGHL